MLLLFFTVTDCIYFYCLHSSSVNQSDVGTRSVCHGATLPVGKLLVSLFLAVNGSNNNICHKGLNVKLLCILKAPRTVPAVQQTFSKH